MQQFQPLWRNLHNQTGHARNISAWLVQGCYKAKPNWVASSFKDNLNVRGCRLCRECRRSSGRGNYSYVTLNKIGGQRGQSINFLLAPTVFDRNVLANDISGFL